MSETITITGEGADNNAKRLDERNKGILFKICAPFTEINKEIKSGSEWKCYRRAKWYFNKFWVTQIQNKNNTKNPCLMII